MAKGRQKRLRDKQVKAASAMDIDDQPALRIEDTRASRNKHEQNEVLKAQHAAGVQKTRDKKRPLRRNQRLRLAKGFERATVVLDQMEKKVNRSEKKNKTIKGRRRDWEDVNTTVKSKGAETTGQVGKTVSSEGAQGKNSTSDQVSADGFATDEPEDADIR